MANLKYFLVVMLVVFVSAKTGHNFTELDVFIVPHSHMDAGWLKTIDEYYDLGVKRIFDSVFDQLYKNKHYTYTLGDIYYFQRWYEL